MAAAAPHYFGGFMKKRELFEAKAGQLYFLKENRKGKENDECSFQFSLGDESAIFSFEVRDEDIISPYRQDNEDIFKGDAVEVFLSPNGDRSRYYEIEVSPYGVRFWAKIFNKNRFCIKVNREKPAYTAQAELTEQGYRVKIDVPYSSLEGFDKDQFLFNAYRLDKKTNKKQRLYALSPTYCRKFHRPKYFIGTAKD